MRQKKTITLGEVEYTKSNHVKFVEDMKKARLDVELYHGRNFYHGPAVRVPSIQMVLSATQVSCVWDLMGQGFIVHPKASDDKLGRI